MVEIDTQLNNRLTFEPLIYWDFFADWLPFLYLSSDQYVIRKWTKRHKKCNLFPFFLTPTENWIILDEC